MREMTAGFPFGHSPSCAIRPEAARRLAAPLALLLAALPLAACQTDGTASAGGGRTLAFESIDGPPQQTFDKLVNGLSTQAQAQRMAVVSRNQTSAYRVKGYLAMHVDRGKASVAYAWDVYDADKTRVMRIAGEEQAGSIKGKPGWAAVDDQVVARIAEKSMAGLAEGLGGGAPAAVPANAPSAEPREAAPESGASGQPVAALTTPPATGTTRALGYAVE